MPNVVMNSTLNVCLGGAKRNGLHSMQPDKVRVGINKLFEEDKVHNATATQ